MHLTTLGNTLLASSQDLRLSSDIAETSNDFLVSIVEAIDGIGNTYIIAELLDQLLSSTQVVARHARIQVVDGLELKTTVEEVEPLGTVDIHGCAKHALRERLVDTEISGAHGEVAECDLNVQGHCDGVTDHDESETAPAIGNALVQDLVAEPVPEEKLAGNLKPAMPPCRTFARTKTKDEILPAQAVEVEAANAEDRVV